MLSVAEIMTRNPLTLGPDDSLAQARQLMSQHHIRHVPIVNGSSLVGVVSQRDVLAAADSSVTNSAGASTSIERHVALSSIMTAPVQTVDVSASLRGTAMQLLQQRMGCLPVMENQELVGIITDADFVAIAINLMEQLEQTEPESHEFEEGFNDGEI